MKFCRRRKNDRGYVALEFVFAMGMLVFPTALIVLQIPGFLEQKDRVTSVAAIVAQECANKASSVSRGQEIALEIAREEINASTSLSRATLVGASCTFDSNTVRPGTHVRSLISVGVPAAVIPGVPQEFSWTMTSTHDVIVPQYRSVDEP